MTQQKPVEAVSNQIDNKGNIGRKQKLIQNFFNNFIYLTMNLWYVEQVG